MIRLRSPREFDYHARVSTLLVPTAEGVTLRFDVAGAASRLAAGLLDLTLLGAVYSILALGLMLATIFDPSGISNFVAGVLLGGAVLVAIAYHVVFHALWAGQTPGKRWLRIRVMSADGYPPSALALVLRGLVWPLDVFLFVPAPLGLIIIAATPKHQRLGDLAAGTLVVRMPREEAAPEPWPTLTWSALTTRTLPLAPGLAARLGARDLELLRELTMRTDLDPEERRKLFVDAARYYAERLELGPFDDARVVLRELYLFARETMKLHSA